MSTPKTKTIEAFLRGAIGVTIELIPIKYFFKVAR